MHVSLVIALVGAAAAVVAVPIAVLQLRQGQKNARGSVVTARGPDMGRPGESAGAAARLVLPAPLGRLPSRVRGRGNVLEELAWLGRRPDGRIHVLAGMGGSGKTTIALALVRSMAAEGLRTWWLAGADPLAVTQMLLGLARRLGAAAGEVEEALAGRVHPSDVLWPRLEDSPGWVLVFDNVDDVAALEAGGRRAGEAAGWLRPTRAGLIVVTSRASDPHVWGPFAQVHRIGPLTDEDGGQVLLDLAPAGGDHAQASKLSSRLGGLALALHQAGTYLASPVAVHRTFGAYGDALTNRFGQMLGRGDDDRARVTSTWELSLTALAAHGQPQARPLLRVLSCFAPATPIPPELLSPEVLGRGQGGIAAAEDGLSGLLATGLIETRESVGGSAPSVLVHPLVAETTRQQAGAMLAWGFARAAELLTTAAGQLSDEDPADRGGWLAVLPHLRFLLALDIRAGSAVLATLADTAARASHALSWDGSYAAGLEIAEAGLAQAAGLDQDSSPVLALRLQRAVALRYLGRPAEAETDFRQILAMHLRRHGPEHPDTLSARHYIAANLADQGKLAEAEVLFRKVLAERLRLLDPDHPHTLATRHWIAAVTARQGKPEQAEAQARDVLAARLRTLGPEHPSTVASSHDLARYVAAQGKVAEAEAMFRQVLAARSRILAPRHPRTLETQYELALTIAQRGNTSGALPLLEQVLKDQTEQLGSSHPEAIKTADCIKRLLKEETQQY